MGKLHEKLSSQKGLIAGIYSRYLVTICAFGLMCILGIVGNYEISEGVSEVLEHMFTILSVLGLGSLLVESFAQSRQEAQRLKVRTVGCTAAGVMAAVWDVIIWNIDENVGDVTLSLLERIFVAYMCTLGFLAVYYIIRNTGLSLQAYGRTALFNLLKMGFTFGAINLGFILIMFMFEALLFNLDVWDWISNFELLITATVYIPYGLICITDNQEDNSKFKKVFLRVALMSMVIAATLIIYAYIVKIFLGGETSNEIFATCAWLFAIGAPIWEMANYETSKDAEKQETNSVWNKIIINMPYIYAPFILLEIYAIGSRISQYGLTPSRYFAIVFIVFQIIYVGWKWVNKYLFKSERNGKEKLVMVGLVLVLMALIFPFLNYSYSCFVSQKSRFNETYIAVRELADAVDDEDLINGAIFLSDEEKNTVNTFLGAYMYLTYDERGRDYMYDRYGKDELNEMVSTLRTSYDYHIYYDGNDDRVSIEWDYLSYDYRKHEVDISGGYTRMYPVSFDDDYSEEHNFDYYSAVEISYDEGQQSVTADIRGVLKEVMSEDYMYYEGDEAYIIDVSDDTRLIITFIDIRKQEDAPVYKGLRLKGYVLKR